MSIWEEELEEEEYYAQMSKNSRELDKRTTWMLTIAGLGALNIINNTLNGSEKEALRSYAITRTRGAVFEEVSATIAAELRVMTTITTTEIAMISPLQMQRYAQILEETRQYSRMIDPKTVENLAFSTQQRIIDQIGMFGAVESRKGGALSVFQEENVLIPWETQNDDSVCGDCNELEALGPYSPDAYPIPPHYGCRCNDPMPDPINVELLGLGHGLME